MSSCRWMYAIMYVYESFLDIIISVPNLSFRQHITTQKTETMR